MRDKENYLEIHISVIKEMGRPCSMQAGDEKFIHLNGKLEGNKSQVRHRRTCDDSSQMV
jgi:hypothetical protein